MTCVVAIEAPPATSGWKLPPEWLELAPGEIHVWRAELQVPEDRALALETLLAMDELERAARFRFVRDRRRYATARAILRTILGRYLGVDAAAVRLEYGAHGKPFLSDPAHRAIRFNTAHSHDLALFAVARGREVGIDVEWMGSDLALAEIAADVCTHRERQAFLGSGSEDSARAAFYRLWTCKEAYVKAAGTGFAIAPDRVEVELRTEGPALREIGGNAGEARRWWLCELHPGPEFAAALAVEGGDCQVRTWSWPTLESEQTRRPAGG